MTEGRLPRAEVASGDDARGELLDLVARVAGSMFQSRAASVMLHDPTRDELVVAAAFGEGAAGLTGRRLPAGTGIAGAVLRSGEAIVVDDVANDPRFGREIADSTGYVPGELMAAPLLMGGRALGVIEVLDRPQFSRFSLVELDLLALYARLAACAVSLLLDDQP